MAAMFDGARKNQTQFLKGGYPKTLSVNFSSNWLSFLSEIKENVKFPLGPMLNYVGPWRPSWMALGKIERNF